jgi:hypothetical protein
MKVTQVQIRNFLKKQLSTNEAWALRALVKVHEFQTMDEQASGVTREANSVGFSGCDAEFLTSLTRQYLTRGSLSQKQMGFVFKKMPRYWGQIKGLIPADQLVALVSAEQAKAATPTPLVTA